ncbi:MAG: prolipoprotein diacylglyceryl transferase [Actinomycetota bacterium]|nr:prolipoprotein diacylglyceryl transferase [Actinomycetota bacterium]
MPGVISYISYNPIVRVHLGPLSISPHGLFIAIGFMIGARFMLPQSRKRGMSDDDIYPLFTRAAIGALIGARVAYVINHFSAYSSSPVDILLVWQGGISLIGGFLGAIAFAIPRMRRERLSFWKVMDAAAPGMALGVFIGRTGDLIIGDHLGKVTSFFLGYRCPPFSVATGSPCAPTALASRTPGVIVHQTALYDQFFALILLLVLVQLRKRVHFDGFLIVVFGLGYGLARIVEDFLRDDVRRFGLTGSQWTALVTVSLCIFTLTVLKRTPRWGHWDDTPALAPVGPDPGGGVEVSGIEEAGAGEDGLPPPTSSDGDGTG